MSEIIKGKLYLGDLFHANNPDFLDENKITAIFCVADINMNPKISLYYKLYKYECKDNEYYNIFQHFDEIADLIEKEQAVLVNCAAGVSRSPTIVMAYLMKYYAMTLRDALYLVKQKRNVILPNPSFLKQLIQYEKKLYNKNSVTYEEAVDFISK